MNGFAKWLYVALTAIFALMGVVYTSTLAAQQDTDSRQNERLLSQEQLNQKLFDEISDIKETVGRIDERTQRLTR